MKPRLLDLFSGAGGSARGYQQAGFHVTGVDLAPQPRYAGDEFIQADALTFDLAGFDAIHASPPCQAYTQLSNGKHPRLIEPVRERLEATDVPWVIENVVGAPLVRPVLLCGSMFGLHVRRHRLFEGDVPALVPQCNHTLQREVRAYYGNQGWLVWAGRERQILRGSVEQAPRDMGIDWMTWAELREAIPPAYTHFIGTALAQVIDNARKGRGFPCSDSLSHCCS